MQNPTKHQLYGHLPLILKSIQIRRTRYAGNGWKSKDELISELFLWTPSRRRASVGRLNRNYLQKFYTDAGCGLEDQPEAMYDRNGWRERIR